MRPKNIKGLEINKILVIGKNCSGYNLVMTPALKKMRDCFKSASMDIVLGKSSAEFAEGNPWFSECLFYEKNLFRFLKTARKKRYDLIVSFGNPLLPFFLRGKFRLSFFCDYFFSEKTFTHESEKLLNFIAPFFGKEDKPHIYFPVSNKCREEIEKQLKKDGIKNSDKLVVLIPGKHPWKKPMPHQVFFSAVRTILDTYDAKIVIAGGDNIKFTGEHLRSMLNTSNVLDYSAKRSFAELSVLLQNADLLLTDSIPHMLLADSAECPVVAVFGPGNPYRFGPLGTKSVLVNSDLDCFPCRVKKTCRKNFTCLEKLSAEKISKAAMLLLDEKEQPLLFDF